MDAPVTDERASIEAIDRLLKELQRRSRTLEDAGALSVEDLGLSSPDQALARIRVFIADLSAVRALRSARASEIN